MDTCGSSSKEFTPDKRLPWWRRLIRWTLKQAAFSAIDVLDSGRTSASVLFDQSTIIRRHALLWHAETSETHASRALPEDRTVVSSCRRVDIRAWWKLHARVRRWSISDCLAD